MISLKVSNDKGEVHVILVISEYNVQRILQGDPLVADMTDMGLPGRYVSITSGSNEQAVQELLNPVLPEEAMLLALDFTEDKLDRLRKHPIELDFSGEHPLDPIKRLVIGYAPDQDTMEQELRNFIGPETKVIDKKD